MTQRPSSCFSRVGLTPISESTAASLPHVRSQTAHSLAWSTHARSPSHSFHPAHAPDCLLVRSITVLHAGLADLAAQLNNVEVLRVLIVARANCNAADLQGTTPLMAAAARGNHEAVCTLLDAPDGPYVADVQRAMRSAHVQQRLAHRFCARLCRRASVVRFKEEASRGRISAMLADLARGCDKLQSREAAMKAASTAHSLIVPRLARADATDDLDAPSALADTNDDASRGKEAAAAKAAKEGTATKAAE